MDGASPARLYALLVGATLVAVGVLGFFYSASFDTGGSVLADSDDVFGILAVNGWHNLVHLATGLLGLAAAGQAARSYALALGLAYLIVAIWGFAETEDGVGVILDLLPVNTEDNWLHLALGLTGLGAGAATPNHPSGTRVEPEAGQGRSSSPT